MYMRLIKYIGNLRIIIVFAILSLFYCTIHLMTEIKKFSSFQHPFLSLLLYLCFFFLIFRFDLNNIMLKSRFTSNDTFLLKCSAMLIRFATEYMVLMMLIIISVGLLIGDYLSWKRLLIYMICTFFSLCIFSVMYVVFSDKTGGLGAKIIMYSYVTATIALGFVNDFFIAVDFLYFNISTGVSASLLLRMACVYIITIVFLYMLTLIRGSEKT